MDCAGCVHSGQEQTGKSISVPFAVQQGTDRTISGGAGAGILYGQYQCQRVLQQKPDAKEGASGTDTDESAGGTAYADGDGTAAAGKRLSGRRDGFPGEKFISGERKNVKLDTDGLAELSQAVRMRLIRKAVWKAAGACKDITAAHLQAVADLLENRPEDM